MAMVYQWKPGARWKTDPQAAGQRFADLVEETDGVLTPAVIVEDARPSNSPLHDDFEWDDSVAAQEWREHTARMMIASVVVVHTPDEKKEPTMPIRAFVNVRQEAGRGYTTTARAVSDEELFSQILDDTLKAINSYRMKLAAFKEYNKIERVITDFVDALQAVKN